MVAAFWWSLREVLHNGEAREFLFLVRTPILKLAAQFLLLAIIYGLCYVHYSGHDGREYGTLNSIYISLSLFIVGITTTVLIFASKKSFGLGYPFYPLLFFSFFCWSLALKSPFFPYTKPSKDFYGLTIGGIIVQIISMLHYGVSTDPITLCLLNSLVVIFVYRKTASLPSDVGDGGKDTPLLGIIVTVMVLIGVLGFLIYCMHLSLE
jgi:hypothetical protein